MVLYQGKLVLTLAKHKLNPEEEYVGRQLTLTQKKLIDNLLIDVAIEKLHLPIDPSNTSAHALQSEYLRGQLDILQHILHLANHTTAGDNQD